MERVNETKIKAFEYLNKHKERVLDLKVDDIIAELVMELGKTYFTCKNYYYQWKEEVLGIPITRRPNKYLLQKPRFKKVNDGVYAGEYGEYSNNGDDGLLLEKGKAYLNFGSRNECIKFFNEALAAYEKIGIGV